MSSRIVDRVNNYEIWVAHDPRMKQFGEGDYQGSVKALRSTKWVYHSFFIYDNEKDARDDAYQAALALPPATKLGARMSVDKEQDGPKDKGRSMQEISKETQSAGFEESPEPQAPEPKKLTPEELLQNPQELLHPNDASEVPIAPAT